MMKLYDRWVDNTSKEGLRRQLLAANFVIFALAWLFAMGVYNLLTS